MLGVCVCVRVIDSCADSPDYVLVRDGADDAPVMARLCGHLPPGDVMPPLVTSSNRATVEFVSDARNQRQGFAGRFTFVASSAYAARPAAAEVAADATTARASTPAGHQADHQLLRPKHADGKRP